MAIEKSILNTEFIQNFLKQYYKIDILTVEKLNRGSSNIFCVKSNNNKYILKEFNADRTEDSVKKEIDIINFLKEKGFSVPTYIELKDEVYYYKYKDRILVLQEFIEGFTIENNKGDYNRIIECADILGRLTKQLQFYNELDSSIVEQWFSKKSLEKGIQKIEDEKRLLNPNNQYRERFEKDYQDKLKIARSLSESFDFLNINGLSIMNSHGDYSVQQLIYNDNRPTTVIDFETARKMPIVWEIMRSYSYIDSEVENGDINIDNLVDYFNMFSKHVPLNESDLKYAPHIYLMQLVGSTFGYREFNKDSSQTELLRFALFRTNLCKSLYNNANEISERLTKEVKVIQQEEREI